MRTVILGNGGHARSLAVLMRHIAPVMVTDDDTVLPDDDVRIGIGDLATRKRLFERFRGQVRGYFAPTAFSASELPRGVQLMPSAIIMPNCIIGENILVNTGAQIDHDCVIGSHCHIAPGAILCGGVTVGEGCFIGAGAVVPECSVIPAGSFVKAGSVWRNTSSS